MRNNRSAFKSRWISGISLMILVALCMVMGGCSRYSHPGETSLERKIRQQRMMRANTHQIAEDFDKLFNLDKHSGLNRKHMP